MLSLSWVVVNKEGPKVIVLAFDRLTIASYLLVSLNR